MRHRHRSAPRGKWKVQAAPPDPSGLTFYELLTIELSSMTVARLKEYAKSNRVKLGSARAKASIIDAIEEAIEHGV